MSGGTAAGADIWDERAARPGLHAVLPGRWTPEQCDRVDHEQKALIERLLPDLDRDRVIDLGCGVGRLTAWLSERTRSAVGVDRSAQMVRRAARAVEGKPARAVCSGIFSATTSTVIRPLAAYEGLAAVAERTAVEHLTYVGDRYLAQLWHT